LYKHIINNNYPPEYQVLCANCNMKKQVEYLRTIGGK
jgi:hypothetical protein